jgi:hypothetical protein
MISTAQHRPSRWQASAQAVVLSDRYRWLNGTVVVVGARFIGPWSVPYHRLWMDSLRAVRDTFNRTTHITNSVTISL